jgi:hypothetical protein
VSMLVSRLRFKYATGASNLIRPREGDLIFIPLTNDFFEITFVENENDQAMFYTLGRGRGGNVYLYALKMKKFVFSDEVVSTGIEVIDSNIRNYYRRSLLPMTTGGSGNFVQDEIVYQGTDLANASAQAIVHTWTTSTRNLEVIRVQGTFANGATITGVTSNASWNTASTLDTFSLDDNAFGDIIDNNRIQREANDILDFSEINPFGEP